MSRTLDEGKSRTADDRIGGGGRTHAGHTQVKSITVRCPNPGCGKVYAVEGRYAGKRGKCGECGTAVSIPADAEASSPTRAGVDGDLKQREHVASGDPVGVREVRAGCIGRGHAGKTAMFHALGEALVGDFLPSGLHIDAGDPREVARMIRESGETQRLLQQCGLPPTLRASQIGYCLYDGDEPLVSYRMHEVIGQILTHTLPDSPATLQARYGEYLKGLLDNHVLWAVVPCPPPDPGPADRRRYANDLRITLAYLREALRLRPPKRPVAVALVLSKIDATFPTAEQARSSLTDDVLRDALGPLVHLVEQSARVSDAVVIPTSAFGFGNAVLREPGRDREGAAPESADEPLESEPIWLLREGAAPRPFNLDTLLLWSLLVGLLRQAGPGAADDPEVGEVCRKLGGDLEAGRPWLLSLKGEIALPISEADSVTRDLA